MTIDLEMIYATCQIFQLTVYFHLLPGYIRIPFPTTACPHQLQTNTTGSLKFITIKIIDSAVF